ncbi:MAG: SusC/RagA family TonB-linked outer membrane protein [Bacteroidetes bacterium]|nr:SusC/RagA family TonB-linked outer membrane protein [Bacteroidota bacterium]
MNVYSRVIHASWHVVVLCLLWGTAAYGQGKVKGTVTDNNGEALIGASVLLKGTTRGVTTDATGAFELQTNSIDDTLIVSYVGYKTLYLPLLGRVMVSVVMEALVLDEVVVTALGIKREERALGYAAQTIGAGDLNQIRDANLVNNLSGKVAGVTVVAGPSGVGSTSRIVVRGENSFNNNSPLFVVDGIPISNASVVNYADGSDVGAQEADYGNGAGEVNPDDIESMTILKGASATALYGSRASNGVVIITTKSGRKGNGLGVSFSSTTTVETPLVMPEYQNDYGQGVNGQFEFGDGLGGGSGVNDDEDQSWGPAFDPALVENDGYDNDGDGETDETGEGDYVRNGIKQFSSPSANGLLGGDVLGRGGADISPTEWKAYPNNVRDFFQTGITTTNNISITGGGDNSNFRLSYTNLNNRGILPGSNLKRNTLGFKAGINPTDRINISAAANYVKTESDHRPSNGYGSENQMYAFTWYGRSLDTKVLKDNLWQEGFDDVQQFNYNYAWHDNPYINGLVNQNALDKDRIFGNVVLNYKLADNIKLMLRSGLDLSSEFRPSYRTFSTQRFLRGGYIETRVGFMETNSDFLLSYDKKLGSDLGLNLSVGGNRMYQETKFLSQTASQLASPGIYSLNNSAVALDVYAYNTRRAINSLYAVGQLAYKNYLYLDVTGRNDWSSTLPAESNSYFYPSVSLSAVVSDMLSLPTAISFAKFRANWAMVGSDTNPYSLRNVFEAGTPYNNSPTALEQSTLANANLLPERQTAWELGADLRFFKGRASADISYYNALSENQIVQMPIAQSSGFSARITNGGAIRSTGIEAMINLVPVETTRFTWNTYFNYSRNRSIIESLPSDLGSEGEREYVIAYARVYSSSSRSVWIMAKEGGRMGDMYGTGFMQVDGQNVYSVTDDGSGNKSVEPVKDPDLRLLGNYNPDFQLGWGNEFSYNKRLHLSFLLDWRNGGTIVSRTQAIASTSGNLITTAYRPKEGIVPEGVKNIGTDENPNYVALESDDLMNSVRYYKAFYDRDNEANVLFDATFVKLREVKVGYTLPNEWFNDKLSNFTISLVGRNLALWTPNQLRTMDPDKEKYGQVTHFDPEMMAMQGQNFIPGVEDMAYPSMRSFGFNISVNF